MNVLGNLDQLDAYLANRADVIDGDYGIPAPNEEMTLQRELEEAQAAIRALLSAGDFMARNPLGMVTDGAVNRWNRATAAFGVKPVAADPLPRIGGAA